ncbi:cytochrome P450 97B2, chloroplastic-like isoform X2 [Carex rostrata]
MEESCETFVPYTLLGFLIRRITDPDPFSSCYSGDLLTSYFLRDYFTRGTNAILWILLFSITFILLSRLAQIVRLWALGGRIPGPPVWPLFGGCATVAPLCGSDRDIDLTGLLSKLHDNYGPLVRLWFGPSQLFVSVKDTQLIKEILVKAKDKLPLSGRAYNLAFGALNIFVPAFNDKIYSEVSTIHKGSHVISTDEVKKMQFLLGTVLESARIMPAGPFLQRCSLKSDMKLENGIVIPAGAIIIVPLHLVQMNASIWGEDFLKFVPSRFLSNENNLDEKESTRTKSQYLNESIKFDALLSFGDGARACVGQSFAVLSSATLVASIVCNFEIKLHPNADKDSGLAAHDSVSQENQSPRIVLSKRTDAY